jgi:FkbM family methyltransferase
MPNPTVKNALISMGLYKPARFLHDHLVRRGRLDEMRQTREAIGKFVKAGDLCFDIGANIGQKSEAMLQLGARVVAVEPQPQCAAELKARCERYPGFVPLQKAVGREPGRATMHISQTEVFSSMHRDWNTNGAGTSQVEDVDVEVTTLDGLIADHGAPDFCKIDVEGFELEVFSGLTRPIKLLSFEFHNLDQPAFLPVAYQCLDHLSTLGEVRINFSLCEDMSLILPDFLPHGDFVAHFNEFIKRPDAVYGDIYVRFPAA